MGHGKHLANKDERISADLEALEALAGLVQLAKLAEAAAEATTAADRARRKARPRPYDQRRARKNPSIPMYHARFATHNM